MIITCPQCTSRYTVPDASFRDADRLVRCSGCGEQWWQPRSLPHPDEPSTFNDIPAEVNSAFEQPVASSGLAAAKAAARRARGTRAEAPPLKNPSVNPADDAPEPARTRESDRDPDAIDVEPNESFEDEIGFDAEVPEGTDEPEDVDDIDIDETADPIVKPLRDNRRPTVAVEKKKNRFRLPALGSPWILAAIAAVGGLLIAVVALLLLKGPLVSAFPSLGNLYAAVGLGEESEEPGENLEIRAVTSNREWTAQGETLVVVGQIANISGSPGEVPALRVSLFDQNDNEVNSVTVTPMPPLLMPGATVPFEARIIEPSADARRIRVTFQPREPGT